MKFFNIEHVILSPFYLNCKGREKILLLEIVQINRGGQDQKTNENQFLVTSLCEKVLFKESLDYLSKGGVAFLASGVVG